ncbi:AraC family transcriptional regulator [uncultured Tateyamaria sp.]|uniref:AraC family transcriptional regulator n=1 Tax=Tateyamaria sp. 1078 TaxID=3417464 RepID=UPI002615EAA2|nr:AraC family transcriptional regulator [uncultured Tateyamaria sp.]
MTARYEDRIRRVLRYIHDNPAGDLSLDTLSDVAALSRFHWHRIFHAMTGETCADAVRRVRAHRASFWLAQTDASLDRIARQVGYSNTQSFERVFRDVFGMTPVSFRNHGVPNRAPLILRTGDDEMYDVKVMDAPARRLAGLEHIGPYEEVGRAFEQVTAVFATHNLWPQARGMVAVGYDDPNSVEPEALRSFAGIEVGAEFVMRSDLGEARVPAGPHAVLRVTGPYAQLSAAYDHLFGQWLPRSAREPADAPAYEVYINSPQDTAPADLITDIHVPLKGLAQSTG